MELPRPPAYPPTSARPDVPFGRPPKPDPLWVSALRGRLLAALASAGSLLLSGRALWDLWGRIQADGLSADHLTTLLALTGGAYDALAALLVPLLSAAALVAAAASKARERRGA